METVQSIKQRFEIIGNDQKLNRAIEKAIQVAISLLFILPQICKFSLLF